MKTPRHTETELEFLRNMYMLEDMKFPAAVLVENDNAKMIGLSVIYLGEAVNENCFGSLNDPGALL